MLVGEVEDRILTCSYRRVMFINTSVCSEELVPLFFRCCVDIDLEVGVSFGLVALPLPLVIAATRVSNTIRAKGTAL